MVHAKNYETASKAKVKAIQRTLLASFFPDFSGHGVYSIHIGVCMDVC